MKHFDGSLCALLNKVVQKGHEGN